MLVFPELSLLLELLVIGLFETNDIERAHITPNIDISHCQVGLLITEMRLKHSRSFASGRLQHHRPRLRNDHLLEELHQGRADLHQGRKLHGRLLRTDFAENRAATVEGKRKTEYDTRNAIKLSEKNSGQYSDQQNYSGNPYQFLFLSRFTRSATASAPTRPPTSGVSTPRRPGRRSRGSRGSSRRGRTFTRWR